VGLNSVTVLRDFANAALQQTPDLVVFHSVLRRVVAFRCIFNCCWRESVKPLQFYCNTVPLSYMIDERKLLFYRNISRSKNVILKILMCLTGVLSDYMFLCSKYGVNCASSKNDIKDAVMHTFIASVAAYL